MKRFYAICLIIFFPSWLLAQQLITGKVVDEQGNTLPGTNVFVKNTTRGTITDLDGLFSLAAQKTDTLVFSMVGLERYETVVGTQTTINVVLKASSRQINEVVVIGYGTSKLKDLTAPIVSLKSEEISRQATANPAQALQGKIAGVTVTNNGEPGSAPQIRIRGVGTALASGSGPLYIVDGVVVSDISFLNNSDIDNVSVLKDASAGAIYGVQAANGVVLITTKKGKKGEPQFNLSAYAGVQHATNLVKMANTSQYIELLNQRTGLTGAGNLYDPANFPVSTQWYQELLRNPFISSVDLNVNGGTDKTLYAFGLSHFYQDGLINTGNKNNHYDRINFRAKNDYTFTNHFTGGFGLIFSRSMDVPTNNYALYQAYVTPPAYKPKDANGVWSDPTALGFSGPFANPAATVYYNDNRTESYSILPNAYLDIKFLNNHLDFRTVFSGDIGFGLERTYTPVFYVSGLQNNNTSNLNKVFNFRRNLIWDNTLNYSQTFGKSDLKVMVGSSVQDFYDTYLSGTRYNVPYLSNATLYLSLGDNGTQQTTDGGNLSRVVSGFTRVSYSYDSKYLLTGTFRADGSSKYANNQWGYFPSLGLGWVLSEENFLKHNKYINFLKIRGSWGKLGNSNVPANSSITYGGPVDGGIFGGNNYIPGLTFSTVIKKPLKWEVIEEYDGGVEAYAFKNKLNFELDYYSRITHDAVFNAPVVGISGTDNLLGNNGKIKNNGIEMVIGWSSQTKSGKIKYNVSTNFTLIHNEVLAINNESGSLYGPQVNGAFITRTIVGKPIGSFYGYKAIGVFQSNSEINNYKSADGTVLQPDAIPGDLKFANTNGDNQINNDDRTYLGSPIPKFTYGLTGGLSYGNWDLSMAIQGVYGNKIFNLKRIDRNAFPDGNYDYNFYQHHWNGPGSTNDYPSAALTRKNIQPNSFFVESGSYIRLRNVQVGYTIPGNAIKKVGFKSFRVYVNAQNPLTIFGYNGFTPEIGGDPISTGIDESTYPLSAIYTFGINATF